MSVVILAAMAIPCQADVIIGMNGPGSKVIEEGPYVEHKFDVSPNFTAIESNCSFDVVFTQSANASAFEVKGVLPDNFIEKLDIKVKNGTLFIALKSGEYCLKYKDKKQKPTIYVTNKSLTAVRASGSSDVTVRGTLTVAGGKFKVHNSGSSDFDAEKIIVTGGKAEFNSSGASDVDVATIVCETLDVELTGASDAEFDHVETTNAFLSASGSSDMKIAGTTANVDFQLTGASEIKARNLDAHYGKANVSGASELKCSVRNFTQHSSGNGEIHNRF